MKRLLTWTGPMLALGLMTALGIFIATSTPADAAPKCNCPKLVQTPEGPCVLIFCSGSNCVYDCP